MEAVKIVSSYAIPGIFLVILGVGVYRDVKVFDVFVDGAKEGVATVVRIIPSLVGLMVAVGVFRASGALDLLIYATRPVASFLGIPSEAMPLAFMRPISGSASLALVSDIIEANGPDSFVGRVVSTMMGSTETIFYTLTVYFGSVGIKNIRYTLVAALIADTVSIIASVLACWMVFGM
ncbi:spore maturation protein [Clostridium thermosuccinogenes]|uniref:Spore maturation protein n=1 Tax=Clostridium thermosuccinogenes TaxID=84032 RepID=A0A2K2FQ83_9CLOT|nr:nucleoside recognition domain-containing protein [Pseudoclostridium thermosuccinogenes]AUS95145.1 spore maturation protein [Pseudoclostridium thermosuccinogenes]PNT99135.1 spore maturation protein [Pseudoclostridium thermosuccinogenes]PNU00939.1 spore maturation protein [Pseudoclostridium thermosuccinogenes]